MSDEVDDLLRRAMATLDHQAPSGYFDTLADRTLARLDGPALAALPAEPASEPPGDDPGLKIVRTVDPAAPRDATAVDAAIATPAPRPRARRAPLVAAIAVGLAAAAGAVIFVAVRDRDASAPVAMQAEQLPRAEGSRALAQEQVEAMTRSTPAAPSMAPSKPRAPATAIAADPAEQAARAGAGYAGSEETAAGSDEARLRADQLAAKLRQMEDTRQTEKDAPVRVDQKVTVTKGDQIPVGKPIGKAPSKFVGKASSAGSGGATLDRNQLSSDDIKSGMNAVVARVRACFDGTQGRATVRLSVAPSGGVQEATVTGPFAGTAVGTCVERAVRTTRFPPWDGPPQSFDYSYRLSD